MTTTWAQLEDKFTVGHELIVGMESGCWEWTANRAGSYGQVKVGGRPLVAHRVSYELFTGPVPAGLVLDHKCRNRICVNPRHLEPVTTQENNRRALMPNSLKEMCPRGHVYEGENLCVELRNGRPHRKCRTCLRERARARRSA